MQTSIEETDEYKVLGSGSMITFNLQPVKLKVSGKRKKEDPVFLEFSFEDDAKKESAHIESNVKGDTLFIKLINYNNVLGTGSAKPLRIGTLEGDELHLQFRAYAFGEDSDKLLFYTIYTTRATKKKGKEAEGEG